MNSENPQPAAVALRPASAFAAIRTPAAVLLFVLTAAIGLGVDLWTKSYSWDALAHGLPVRDEVTGHLRVDSDTIRAIPGWLHFKVTVNEGAVFGLGQGNQTLFAIVSVFAIGCLVYFFATSGDRWFYQLILGMLLAGVLGNLYDRMVYGYVRDMLYALPGRTWPGTWTLPLVHYPGPGRDIFPWIFNIADTLLCVGVGLLVVYSFFAHEPEPRGTDFRPVSDDSDKVNVSAENRPV